MKKILGVITARGESKTVPKKNIKLLGGKPLIAWTIEVAKKSKLISHLIVSTDDKEIAQIAQTYGVDVPFLRPKELAGDEVGHLPVMQHAIGFMEKKLGFKFDYAVILQPTSPFRTPEDIDQTLKLLERTGADSAVTMVEVATKEHPVKMKRMAGERVLPFCREAKEPEGSRKQDFPKAFKRSSAVYAQRRDLLIKEKRLYGDYVVGLVVPRERSIDIDDEFDFLRAEYMLKNLNL